MRRTPRRTPFRAAQPFHADGARQQVAAIACPPKRDPDARNGAGAPTSRAAMLTSFLRREPKAPETLGVRTGGNPNDAVVQRSGDEVDSAPAP
jgi:hypothetical protein